jgi:hypothetical protein
MGSRIMLRVMHLCAALLVTVGSTRALAQAKQEVDLLIGGEFVVTMDEARPVIGNGAVSPSRERSPAGRRETMSGSAASPGQRRKLPDPRHSVTSAA